MCFRVAERGRKRNNTWKYFHFKCKQWIKAWETPLSAKWGGGDGVSVSWHGRQVSKRSCGKRCGSASLMTRGQCSFGWELCWKWSLNSYPFCMLSCRAKGAPHVSQLLYLCVSSFYVSNARQSHAIWKMEEKENIYFFFPSTNSNSSWSHWWWLSDSKIPW